MSHDLSLCFQNATGRLRTLRLEPWARHFILTPDEKVEVIARAKPGGPSLRVVEASDATLIYTTGCDRVWVIQEGISHELLPVYAVAAVSVRSARRDENPLWDRDLDG
jgi:hypothetical protein